jgi:primosomal protein N' (replication factor Y)
VAVYIQVAVNVPQVSSIFDYHLPPELEGRVLPGCLVIVPFGHQLVQGIVIAQADTASVPETRPIDSLVDPAPVLTSAQMQLARQLANETLSPLASCLDLMIPSGLSQQADSLYTLVPNPAVPDVPLFPIQQHILTQVEKRGGQLRGRQIETAFPRQNWEAAVKTLVRQGRLTRQPILPPPTVRPRTLRTVHLAASPEAVDTYLKNDRSTPAAERRKKMLFFLQQEPWPVDAAWVYAAAGGGTAADLTRLAEDGMVILGESEVWRDPLEKIGFVAHDPPILTPAQKSAWEAVDQALTEISSGKTRTPILLHGVTGSGKTEIYLRAAARVVEQGRQVIILVPEIALTPQTVRRFMARFPGEVGLVHSQLSPGERYDTWRRARAGLLSVIVGARSALFAPLPNPGLVIIDECHENTYYQDDILPYYNALTAAEMYMQINRGLLLLGTATPPVELLQRAAARHWTLLSLPERVLAHRQAVEQQLKELGRSTESVTAEGEATTLPLPPVSLVDMRQELKDGNRSIFSRELQDSLQQVLSSGQQAILYLNRRGSATYVFCRECGFVLCCPRCNLPLTFHNDPDTLHASGSLRCHTCSYTRLMPKRCPNCGSKHIRQFGTGTEKVEAEVMERFPNARTLRWDYETTRAKGAHDILLSHFLNQRADILIGTQMLAKGLDLPLVTLVGVVLADVGLNLPDFRAAERTFQLLMQVAGRAGRSPLGGKVVLQTFMPEHYAIQAAASYDFKGFTTRELEYRRQTRYPPFTRLARLEYRSLKADQAEQAAMIMAGQLKQWIEVGQFSASELIGPAPCFFAKRNGYYRWQIILRSPDPAAILRGRTLGDWRVQIDPLSLL